ncbi:MAG TPA: ABC transporter permease [Thermoanaerobaculia bacterium]|nr:ABC transporter permease [Thermoanaerobaculia bacterium]
MTPFVRDLRFSLRMLLKTPGHTAAAVAALALGLGLATGMFSIVYGVLLRGLPFEKSDRILHLECNNPSREQRSLEVFHQDYLEWHKRQRSFQDLAAFYDGTVNLAGEGDEKPERFEGAFMTANSFDVLPARPLLGRGFLRGEDSPQAEPVVILSYGLWKTRYQGDPKIVGRPVRINGAAGTIVGVMPQGFAFPLNQVVWTNLRQDPFRYERGQEQTLEVYGRLRDGVTMEQAQAEMDGIAKALAAEYRKTNEGRGAVVKPYIKEFIGDEASSLLYTMLGACLFVLLLACTNVASLTMARASQRTREIAIRSALGAARWLVIRQLLLESLLLSLIGGALGVLLGSWGARLFNASVSGFNPPFWIRIGTDPTVLLFAFGAILIAALVSGLAPALQASRADLNEILKDEGRGSSSLRLGRFSRIVVVAEVAVSCILLVGAGLMVKTVVNLQTMNLGFEPEGLFTGRVALFDSSYPEKAKRLAFFETLLDRVGSRPDVAAAALTTNLPSNGAGRSRYLLEGKSYPDERDQPVTSMVTVSPGLFTTLGAKVLQGRDFGSLDREGNLPVVIVNQSFAAEVWPGEDPLGKRLRLPGEKDDGSDAPWRTVVGVVPDLLMGQLDEPDEQGGVYLPMAQVGSGFMSLVVRTRQGEPMAITDAVRQTVESLDRDLPVYFTYSMEEVLARSRFFFNLFGTLFTIFGAAALLLASVGIYGVIAFSVEQRTQEIGIRMALGAQRGSVLGLILRQGMWQLAVGLLLGLPVAFWVSRLLGGVLVGVDPHDVATFTGVGMVLAAVALFACWLPAQRASQTDPLVAMRYD